MMNRLKVSFCIFKTFRYLFTRNNHVKGDHERGENEEDSNSSAKKRLAKKFKSSDEPEENMSSPSEMKSNKSLLEQLLIEIPGEDSRKTRSWHR